MFDASSIMLMTWGQFFNSPWASSIEIEKKVDYLRTRLCDLNMDLEIMTIFSIISLFSTDGISDDSVGTEALQKAKY